MGKDGGTRFWCEQCSQTMPFTVTNDHLFEPHNGLYEIDGIPLRRRRKYCTQCGFEIVTVEMDEFYFDNLLKLQRKMLTLMESLNEEVAKMEIFKEERERRIQARIDALLKNLGIGD